MRDIEKRRDCGYIARGWHRAANALRDITRTNGLACGGSGTKTSQKLWDSTGYHDIITRKSGERAKKKHMYIVGG